MAAGKLTPRQKMINMMYLVLTALLALNVSKEVLDSFFSVNKSIVESTESIEGHNQETYQRLSDNATEKVKPFNELAIDVRSNTEPLTELIQSMKYNLVLKADKQVYLGESQLDSTNSWKPKKGVDGESRPWDELDPASKKKKISYLRGKSNRTASGDVFMPKDDNGSAKGLRDQIYSYENHLVEMLESAQNSGLIVNSTKVEGLIKDIRKVLTTKDKREKDKIVTWQYYNFYDMPAVAAFTFLSKLQSDIKTIESDVINFLAESITAQDFKVSGLQAQVVQETSTVLRGDENSTKIFLSAFDNSQQPEIYIEDSRNPFSWTIDPSDSTKRIYTIPEGFASLEVDANGVAQYNPSTSSPGSKSYNGVIKLVKESGPEYFPFSQEYLVVKPTMAVSPTAMNIFYIGVDNPIEVSVAGYQNEDIKISCSNGTVSTVNRKEGEYTVKVKGGRESIIKLSVTGRDGKTKSIDERKFRIKSTPKSQVNLPSNLSKAYKANDPVGKAKLTSVKFSAGNPDFMFPIRYKVKSFTVQCTGTQTETISCKGSKLNPRAKTEIKNLISGQMVVFKDFQVVNQATGKQENATNSFNFVIK